VFGVAVQYHRTGNSVETAEESTLEATPKSTFGTQLPPLRQTRDSHAQSQTPTLHQGNLTRRPYRLTAAHPTALHNRPEHILNADMIG
jgi:hypothetical protein